MGLVEQPSNMVRHSIRVLRSTRKATVSSASWYSYNQTNDYYVTIVWSEENKISHLKYFTADKSVRLYTFWIFHHYFQTVFSRKTNAYLWRNINKCRNIILNIKSCTNNFEIEETWPKFQARNDVNVRLWNWPPSTVMKCVLHCRLWRPKDICLRTPVRRIPCSSATDHGATIKSNDLVDIIVHYLLQTKAESKQTTKFENFDSITRYLTQRYRRRGYQSSQCRQTCFRIVDVREKCGNQHF